MGFFGSSESIDTWGEDVGLMLFSVIAFGYDSWINSLITSLWIDWPYRCSRTSFGTEPFLNPSILAFVLTFVILVLNFDSYSYEGTLTIIFLSISFIF